MFTDKNSRFILFKYPNLLRFDHNLANFRHYFIQVKFFYSCFVLSLSYFCLWKGSWMWSFMFRSVWTSCEADVLQLSSFNCLACEHLLICCRFKSFFYFVGFSHKPQIKYKLKFWAHPEGDMNVFTKVHSTTMNLVMAREGQWASCGDHECLYKSNTDFVEMFPSGGPNPPSVHHPVTIYTFLAH